MTSSCGTRSDKVGPLRKVYEADAAEISRCERTQHQFRAVLQTLQRKADELEADSDQLSAGLLSDRKCERLEHDVAIGEEEAQTLDSQYEGLVAAIAEARHRSDESVLEGQIVAHTLEEVQTARVTLAAARERSEKECEATLAEARSMVTNEALQRFEEEATRVYSQLEEQEAETSRLRQALADSWAARAEPGPPIEPASNSTANLERMEEEVNWLAKVQQEASDERWHVQKLERSEAALQAELREVSEEKAALQSARVDLGDTGRAMREAIAHQSEGYVQRVVDLEGAKRTADEDRVKLLQECADLQARLDGTAPELTSIRELEGRHARINGERRAVVDECERLRAVNEALGALLLGPEAPPMMSSVGGDEGDSHAVAEAISRVLQLRLRLTERLEAHAEEKLKLADRIRQLERDNAQGAAAVVPSSLATAERNLQDLQGSRAPPELPGGRLAAATSLFKGGLGKILPPR